MPRPVAVHHVPVPALAARIARRWWFVAAGATIVLSAFFAVPSVAVVLRGGTAFDWRIFAQASERVWDGDLYAETALYGYRYSPLFAYAFGLIAPLGFVAWRAVLFAAALSMPTWPLRVLTLASWPFWFDVQNGSLLTVIVLTAAWALRGNRVAALAFLALALLIPRPLMLPVTAWLLWHQPWIRVPFIAMFAAHAGAVALSGWGDEWINRLFLVFDSDVSTWSNISPSRFIGAAWIPIGIAIAAWFAVRGRLGFASVVATPYVMPYYLLFLVLELVKPSRSVDHERATSSRHFGVAASLQPVRSRIARAGSYPRHWVRAAVSAIPNQGYRAD